MVSLRIDDDKIIWCVLELVCLFLRTLFEIDEPIGEKVVISMIECQQERPFGGCCGTLGCMLLE